jgi:hypothetical protein
MPYRDTSFDPKLVQTVTSILGIASSEVDPIKVYRDTLTEWDWDASSKQIKRALDELAEISKASGIPVAVTLLRANVRKDDLMGQGFVRSVAERGIVGADVNLDKFLQPGETAQEKFFVSRVEPHPNPDGHELIAGELRRQIFDANPLFQIPSAQ